MLSGLVTAIRTLTVFTVPGKDTESFSRSLFWFPMVGLLLGLMQATLAYYGHLLAWNELAAALVVFAGMALTRGMHADGLADMADGFWGGKGKEAALRIMKDPNVGSFGAIALFALLLLKWIAMLKLIEQGAFPVIVSGVLLARWVQVLLASSLPYARSEGGTAQAFVSGAGASHSAVASILTFCFLLPLFYPDIIALVFVISAAGVAGVMIALLSYRKIGGVTGDVLGAGSEVTEALVWVAGAITLSLS
ncbi:MAG: adenosylcobinamide-GDP ribazoletransferase [Chlorobium sp.]|nr:MAG: adenosylcobinamide-GDP ribazoletransferase [Chlorobium sp.]